MLAACFTAMAVPIMLRCPPIYDLLGERLHHKSSESERRQLLFALRVSTSE
jgi:CIC family chloride channel protein